MTTTLMRRGGWDTSLRAGKSEAVGPGRTSRHWSVEVGRGRLPAQGWGWSGGP